MVSHKKKQSKNSSHVGTSVTVSYSDIEGGWPGAGSNNIATDLFLVDISDRPPKTKQFHLSVAACLYRVMEQFDTSVRHFNSSAVI